MPDARHAQPFHHRQLIQITLAAGGVSFVTGFIVSDAFDSSILGWLPRVALAVCAVVFFEILSQIRTARQLARFEDSVRWQLAALERLLDERLGKAVYAEGYVDGVQRRVPAEERHLRSVP